MRGRGTGPAAAGADELAADEPAEAPDAQTAHGYETEDIYGRPLSTDAPLRIDLDTLDVPAPGGEAVDPARWLPESVLSPLLVALDAAAAELASLSEDAWRAGKAHIAPRDYPSLLRTMHAAGLVEFRPGRRSLYLGLFQVAKRHGRTRLIINGIPINRLIGQLDGALRVRMPQPDLLARVRIPPGASLSVGLADLDNFFHRLAALPQLAELHALEPVDGRKMGLGDGWVTPHCTTCIMGSSVSPLIAHTTAVQVLTRALADGPTPEGCTLHIVGEAADMGEIFFMGMDDVIILQFLDDTTVLALDESRAARTLEWVVRAFSAAGLPVKKSKVVRPGSQATYEALGLELTTSGTVRPGRSLRQRIRVDGEAMLANGWSTGAFMASWTSRVVWSLLLRRLELSGLSVAYAYVREAGGPTADRHVHLFPNLRTEIEALMAVVDTLEVDMHKEVPSFLLASDASSYAAGLAEACVPVRVARDVLLASRSVDVGPAFGTGPDSVVSTWKDVATIPFRRGGMLSRNILDKELVGSFLAHERAVRHRGLRDADVPSLFDNLAGMHLLLRGRGKQPRHRHLLRQFRDLQRDAGIVFHPRYASTTFQPADFASRRRPTRATFSRTTTTF